MIQYFEYTLIKTSAVTDSVFVIQAHSPHQLSVIEEASRESFTLFEARTDESNTPGHHPDPKHDSSEILEKNMQQSFEFDDFEEMASNVGPHGFQYRDLIQNTAETVLYGNWEQDNNLDDINRPSSMWQSIEPYFSLVLTEEAPDTVIHYEMNDSDGGRMAPSSDSGRSAAPQGSVVSCSLCFFSLIK